MKALSLKMAVVSALLVSSQAFAGILTMEAGSNDVEGVAIAKSAKVSLNKQDISLDLIGAGLRSKRVIIANVRVYVAQLLSSDASKFVRDEKSALGSLDQSRTTVMALTFLRTVDAPTVQTSFKDALKANSIDINEKSLAAFLSAVSTGGDAEEGKTLVIAMQKNSDESESVTYEDTNGKATSISGAKGLGSKIMAIWLGIAADSGIETLKQSLISGN